MFFCGIYDVFSRFFIILLFCLLEKEDLVKSVLICYFGDDWEVFVVEVWEGFRDVFYVEINVVVLRL